MGNREYIKQFEAALDAWYAEIKLDLDKLNRGGEKPNWSALRRIRIYSRGFRKLYVTFRDASISEETLYNSQRTQK